MKKQQQAIWIHRLQAISYQYTGVMNVLHNVDYKLRLRRLCFGQENFEIRGQTQHHFNKNIGTILSFNGRLAALVAM